MSEPYRIEVERARCEHRGFGASWIVVGPDEIALGISFGSEDDAEDTARMLCAAFEAGRAAA